jgi:glucose/arabinose dehydrogenase
MSKRLLTCAAAMLAASISVSAQTPQNPPAQPQAQPAADRAQPATDVQTPAAGQMSQVLTISGCLKEEKDVAGLKPNVAERAGVTEDYILTDVKMAPSSTVSGIAVASRYEIEGIAEADLKKHVNHQVEITGTITQPTAAGNDPTPDFKGTALKMVSATCTPAK